MTATTNSVQIDFSTLILDTLGHTNNEFVSLGYVDGSGTFRTAVMSPADAITAAAQLPADRDCYFGVNPTAGPARSGGGRGKSEDVTRLTALYTDIDVKPGACPTLDVGKAIIAEVSILLGTRPSVIVYSGGGLQPYWPISDGTDTAAARVILKRFGRLVDAVAERHNVAVDNVHELARMLRLPGSNNMKTGEPRLVVAAADTGGPLTIAEIAERLDEFGIPERPGDTADSQEVSPPVEWQWAETTCPYVAKMIAGFPTDTPKKGRNPWLLSQRVRLACAHRLGCITETDHKQADDDLTARFAEIVSNPKLGEPRPVKKFEHRDTRKCAIGKAAAKTDEQVRDELGGHTHIKDSTGTGSGPCTGCGTQPDDPNTLVNGYCTGCTGKTPFKDVHETERPLWPSPSAPLDVARRLYTSYRRDGLNTLLAWRGGWMLWQHTHWTELDPAALRSRVYDILGAVDYMKPIRKNGEIIDYERTPWDPNKRKVCDVLEAMQAVGHLSTEVDPPSWIYTDAAANIPANQIVSCTNGLLVLSTRTAKAHTPAFFNTVSVPFDHDTNAAEPKVWLDFLDSIWPDDPDSVLLLQEYLGYVLSGRTDMQKLLLLIGPTRSGKGTIARMLTELVGRGHVAGPTLASLGTNFGLSPLLGKPLAIISDARLGSAPAHTVVERLLSITGEDMLTVDRKFLEPWSGKVPTRFVVLSNELPRFSDSSGAIANRLLILQMTNSFLGREDRTLDDRLRQELPGILNWCLDGLDRLTRNGRFTVPGSSKDAATLMMDLASPVSAFVRDKCDRTPSGTVEADVLYSAWKQWAEDNGHRASSKSTFGRDLRAVVPEIRVTQPTIDGRRVRSYVCIALLPVHPVHEGESAGQSAAGDGADSAFARADPVQQPEIPLDRAESPRSRCGCGNEMFSAKSIERGQCERCHLAAKRTGGAA